MSVFDQCTQRVVSRRRAATGAILVACSLLWLPSCSKPAPTPAPRVLIIGIDGAAPQVVDTLFAMGKLKNLHSLKDHGAYGPIKSDTAALLSPRVWTTMATGKTPDKHGIVSWVKFGKDATADLFYSTDRHGLALWNILSDAGKRVAVVNWLITYPPETINGVMVSDHALARELEGKKDIGEMFAKGGGAVLNPVRDAENSASAVYPEEWAARALAPAHSEDVLTNVANPFLDSAPDNGFRGFSKNLSGFWEVDQRLASITLEILDEKKPDVTMLLLQGIDRVSHFMFGCLESPELDPPTFHITAEQRQNCTRALYDYYEFTDQLIGRLLARFNDNDLVMVVSDHGFESEFKDYRTGGHSSEAASYGVCFARGPRVKVDTPVQGMTVADLTPTILDWYGLPLAKDMDGKPATFLENGSAAPKAIATYDTKPVERLGDGKSGGELKVKEDLRSLGYLQ
jgi:predicted AlkP superfamily phosphohydrolase/phosphomutase